MYKKSSSISLGSVLGSGMALSSSPKASSPYISVGSYLCIKFNVHENKYILI